MQELAIWIGAEPPRASRQALKKAEVWVSFLRACHLAFERIGGLRRLLNTWTGLKKGEWIRSTLQKGFKGLEGLKSLKGEALEGELRRL